MGIGEKGRKDPDRAHRGAYANHGMEKSPSVYTIDTLSSQWQGSRDTVTTDTNTRRSSQDTNLTTDTELFPFSDGKRTRMDGSTDLSTVSSTAVMLEKDSKDDEKERESWDNKIQYMLAVIGFAVGLGNVWRFPYLVQKNGGGAFLIPYTIMLAIEGVPIFYLELAVGQRLRKGAIGAWNEICPYLGGIGIACAFVSFWVALYYNTIIAWCLVYFVQSFQSPLPWAECPGTKGGVFGNESIPIEECKLSGPTTYFWYRETLNISPSVEVAGDLNWWIIVSLLCAWVIVYLCMVKGITSSGKVVYVTATFPYLVLIIFFFRGVTLEGFHHGLYHLFVPEFSRLADPQVWLDAATQIFFSLGLAFGGLIAFSSYNPVRNNCYRDAILVSVVNCGTSLFAGIVVFSILGHKATVAHENCLSGRNSELVALFNTSSIDPPPTGSLANFTIFDETSLTWTHNIGVMPNITQCSFIEELQKSASGTGLAFIAFTEAINQFPVAPLWSVLFFLMLFTLGLDSMFGTLEGVVTSIVDMNILRGLRKEFISAVICLVSLLLSFSFAHQAGPYIFVLFDEYSGNIPLLVIALFEVVGVAYIYGLKRFSDDIELMTGQRPNYYWLLTWRYISPLAMILILIASVVKMGISGTTYEAWDSSIAANQVIEWPGWCKFLSAFLILTSVLWIPAVALVKYFNLYNWEPEKTAYFPETELKEERDIVKPYVPSTWEHRLFYLGEKK
ncbi:hypothetical protein ScPMuIL_001619 [Solemya velum]